MRFRKTVATLATAMAGILIGSPAHATIYSLVDDFGSSVFQYSYGSVGGTLTTMSVSNNCINGAITCFSGSSGNNTPPLVALNDSGSSYNFATVQFPTGYLLSHPGPDSANPDTVISFIASISSLYKISLSVARLDTTTNGNGVNFSIGIPTDPSFITAYINNSTPYGQIYSTGSPTVFLNAGQTIDLIVSNAGEYTYDSTGLFGTIESLSTSVPEPATWALMLSGFAALGVALRRRPRSPHSALSPT